MSLHGGSVSDEGGSGGSNGGDSSGNRRSSGGGSHGGIVVTSVAPAFVVAVATVDLNLICSGHSCGQHGHYNGTSSWGNGGV